MKLVEQTARVRTTRVVLQPATSRPVVTKSTRCGTGEPLAPYGVSDPLPTRSKRRADIRCAAARRRYGGVGDRTPTVPSRRRPADEGVSPPVPGAPPAPTGRRVAATSAAVPGGRAGRVARRRARPSLSHHGRVDPPPGGRVRTRRWPDQPARPSSRPSRHRSVGAGELPPQLGQRPGQQPGDVHLRDADLVGDLRLGRLP